MIFRLDIIPYKIFLLKLYDIQKNGRKVIAGSPSYACLIICKIIPLLMIGIYTFKAGKGLKVENEGYLVAGAISFWIMSFFKKSYESALESFHSYSTNWSDQAVLKS